MDNCKRSPTKVTSTIVIYDEPNLKVGSNVARQKFDNQKRRTSH